MKPVTKKLEDYDFRKNINKYHERKKMFKDTKISFLIMSQQFYRWRYWI